MYAYYVTKQNVTFQTLKYSQNSISKYQEKFCRGKFPIHHVILVVTCVKKCAHIFFLSSFSSLLIKK